MVAYANESEPDGLIHRSRQSCSVMYDRYTTKWIQTNRLYPVVRYLREYREACLFCFTETWLNDQIPDSAIDLPNFDVIRGDRTS